MTLMWKVRRWKRAIQLDIKAEKLVLRRRLGSKAGADLSEHTQVIVVEEVFRQEVEERR
jgi:hypothetical protein